MQYVIWQNNKIWLLTCPVDQTNQPGRATITEPLSPQNVGNPFDDMSVEQIADAESEFDRIYERDPDGEFVFVPSFAKRIRNQAFRTGLSL